ncbi:MAG: phage tail protein [Methanothrix sp.]|nr:phage tail protein [Methanothrix sp.]MCX8208003.1 phage tail protein [Methanothrix sp.]
MPNRRPFDHIGGFNFKVEIEGVTQGAFRNVEGLDSETEVIEFQDGDDIILRKRPGRTKYSNIVLKRGYVASDELWQWRKKVIEGKVERKSGSIILCADDGSEITRYNFFEAWPCKWKGFTLDGKGNDVTVEELELAVEKIEKA